MINTCKARLVILVFTSFLASCDKASDLLNDWKNDDKNDGKELTLSHDEIAKSDAAVLRYMDLMEKVPTILASVRDEKSAFAARNKIDELSREASDIVVDLVPVDGKDKKKMLQARVKTAPSNAKKRKQSTPDIQGGVHWAILEENKGKYSARTQKIVRRIVSQMIRIERVTRDSAIAFDVVVDGVFTLASVESGGKAPNENPKDELKSMPKDWLPPGVTRE